MHACMFSMPSRTVIRTSIVGMVGEKLRRLAVGAAVFAVCALTGCTTVEGTGRSQFNLLSRDSELQLGREAYAEQLKEVKLITSGAQYEMVRRVCQRVADAATRRHPDATQ